MFRRLSYLIAVLLLAAMPTSAQLARFLSHQIDSSRLPMCGVTPEYISTLGVGDEGTEIPTGFPASAIDTCGKFAVYYYDQVYGPGYGFADASVGATRRSTMCAVLAYVQSVYDFSSIPDTSKIRIRVSQSYSPLIPYIGPIAWGAPYYSAPATGAIENGYVHRFVKSGIDPNPRRFHGTILLNFDSTSAIRFTRVRNTYITVPVETNNGLGPVQECQIDLFSTLLHMVNHVLGYYSLTDVVHGGKWTPGAYSSIDTSVRQGPDPYTSPTAFTDPLTKAYLSGLWGFWIDSSAAPYRTYTDLNTHFWQIPYFTRFSMGDYENHTMRQYCNWGVTTREYSKVELKIGNKILHYDFNPTLFSTSGTTSMYYANKRPYWDRCYDFNYYPAYTFSRLYYDTTTADYTITNDIGSSLVIHLNADTNVHDDDGDTIRIIPESLVNVMGCGDGTGNNHNAITLANGNTTIIYTPRPNFYGRAMVGFNLTDGKEKGAFMWYIIDVAKGTNVNVPFGGNLVLNGDMEEGTEVKVTGNEFVNNNTWDFAATYEETRIKDGFGYADGQVVGSGVVIRNSYTECPDAHQLKRDFGTVINHFPWSAWDFLYIYTTGTAPVGKIRFPEAKDTIGNRYSLGHWPALYYLADSVRNCHNYLLEFDANRTWIWGWTYPAMDTIKVAFTNPEHIKRKDAFDAHKIWSLPPQIISPIDTATWTHISIPFTYCADTPATMLYLENSSLTYRNANWGTYNPINPTPVVIDNISLREQDFAVTISDTAIGGCTYRLKATASSINACTGSITYDWKTSSGTPVSTSPLVDVAPSTTTTYIVTASIGCDTARDTITLAGSTCPCSPAAIFGDTIGYYTLSGTVSSIPSVNYYHVKNDITIVSDITFKDANVLIAPNVKITVRDSSKLTLDSAHLFTCPDSAWIWKGIVLGSSTYASGRIEIKNNSLIEDAAIAIEARDMKDPGDLGDVLSCTNSIFNRNYQDINLVHNYIRGTAGIYPITIKGTVFTSRSFDTVTGYPRLWPRARALHQSISPAPDATAPIVLNHHYAKALCKDGRFSYMAIQLDSMGHTFGAGSAYADIQIGGGTPASDRNLFDNHQYGIHSWNSNMVVNNCYFMNISKVMVPDATYKAIPRGIGIVAQGDVNIARRLKVESSLIGNSTNTFFDCHLAIYTNNLAHQKIKDAVITSSHVAGGVTPGAAWTGDISGGTGIYVMGTANYTTDTIVNNRISNLQSGIYVGQINPKENAVTVITNNNIFGENPDAAGYTANQFMLYAIESNSGGDVKKGDMYINSNTLTGVYNGIKFGLYKTVKVQANNNTISLKNKTTSPASPEQFGICAWSNINAQASANTISSPSLGTYADRIKGIHGSYNTGMSICGNSINHIGRSFEFAGITAQPGTIWTHNTMQDGYRGLMLGSAIGRQQESTTVLAYTPPSCPGCPGTILLRRDAWYAGNKWSGSWSSRDQTYAGIDAKSSILNVRYAHSDELPTVNTGIAGFEYNTIGYTGFWPGLYTGTVPASLQDFGTGLHACGNPNPGGGGGPVTPPPPGTPTATSGIAYEILADATTDYDPAPRPNQWLAQLALWQNAVMDTTIVDSNAIYRDFMTNAAGSRFEWITDIEKALAESDTATAAYLLNNPVSAMGDVNIYDLLTITDGTYADPVVDKHVAYYTEYLSLLKGNGLDTPELYGIAALCPALYGSVVYQARDLYRRVKDTVIEYSDDSCWYNNTYRIADREGKSAEAIQQYSLYPNPNTGVFMLRQSVPTNKIVHLKVYNAMGAVVQEQDVPFVNGLTRIDMGQKPQGLYLVCVDDGKEHSVCLRFVLK